jgi:hypothetical protein
VPVRVWDTGDDESETIYIVGHPQVKKARRLSRFVPNSEKDPYRRDGCGVPSGFRSLSPGCDLLNSLSTSLFLL